MTSANDVELMAHRGVADPAPENSLEAIRLAWAVGADAVEIDVRVSADGIGYLFHDDRVNGLSVSGASFHEIREQTGVAAAPRFVDLLALGPNEGDYLLDIKEPDAARIQVLLDEVEATGFPLSRLIFQNERIDNLNAIKRRFPNARTCLLSELKRRPPFFLRPTTRRLLRQVAGQGVNALSIKGRSFIDRAFIETLRSTGMRVYVWTINDPERAVQYRDMGVDGVITDRIELMQQTLGVVDGR